MSNPEGRKPSCPCGVAFRRPAGVGCPQAHRHAGNPNPVYRLSPADRNHLRILARLRLWPDEKVAKAFGVTRKRVYMARTELMEEL